MASKMNPAKPAPEAAVRSRLSAKAEQFTESVIREMTGLALQHNAINLSQGFHDCPAPAARSMKCQTPITFLRGDDGSHLPSCN